jgi:hypothetical protein
MFQMFRLLGLVLLLCSGMAIAQDYVPEELEGWQRWVLKDTEYRNCPFMFDRTSADRAHFLCAWPGRLQLDVTADGARFEQQWTLYEETQWIALPGSPEHWPDQVAANGRTIEVIERDGAPSVSLAPGSWRLTGQLVWDERPAVLRISPASGLLSLTIDGQRVDRPELNGNRVFLGERKADGRQADSVRAVVYRLVADRVPTQLVTHLEIDVSGSVREERFGPLLPEGFVPLSMKSPIPAKLEADGTLHVQVRPGRWEIEVAARGSGALNEIRAPATGVNLPETEIWSYAANDRLRVSAVEGLPPVDPLQVDVPYEWESLPAYRVGPNVVFPITERSRGVVAPHNELALARTMWLDFDGTGFVVKDEITGQMRTDWRLDMAPPYTLLAASELGDSLLITRGPEPGETGVEVRAPELELEALGRSESRAAMPATGWDSRFASVEASLNLPPGHKLLAAPGVDRAIGSWVDRWALLDFFLVLIVTIAAWRLFSPAVGIVALLALGLSYHEMMAPTWLWLNLLVGVALLRVAPAGRLYRLVRSYLLVSAALLVIVLVPFVANQVRIAIYPQLESQRSEYIFARPAPAREAGIKGTAELQQAGEDRARPRQPVPSSESLEEIVVVSGKTAAPDRFARFAPNAIVQAGPGVPSWRWNTYRLVWSGPVEPDQAMRLVVLPRWLVSTVRFALVGLVLAFAALLAAEITHRRWTLPGGLTLGRDATAAATVALVALLLSPGPAAHAQLPDQELLRQLQERLLEPPECVPRCAEIAAASIEVGTDSVRMDLSIHALEPVAIPLPGSERGWRPGAVLVDGSSDAQVLRASNGLFWIQVAPGRHVVTLRGSVPDVDSLEIPFPTPPRVIRAASEAWLVAGIKDRRLLSGSLQLTRLRTGEGSDTVRWESSRFPAFARVSRHIAMDLDWEVRTTVERMAPLEGALTIEVPLLEGESIVSGTFEVRDGRVLVSMQPSEDYVSWSSTLPLESPLTLEAPEAVSWTEVWDVAVGSIWHVTFDGVPESNIDPSGDVIRRARFDPRGGETLVVAATRPDASEGNTLAFDVVGLDVAYGNRSRDVTMTLAYRSTRGAQHVIRLPGEAEVTAVTIDGQDQSLRAENGELTVPIQPGEHTIAVAWRTPGGMDWRVATPLVDLGAPAGNIELSMSLPRDRWLLATSGPQLGPAVLYWTELAVLLLAAVILGRVGLAPLGTWQWVVLGLGFSTFSWGALALVVIWLFVCGARERFGVAGLNWWQFNVAQVVIAATTVLALLAIVSALPQGLLGTPDMHVAGNDSFAGQLAWFADRSVSDIPQAAALTVPMWIYKGIILAWALWLSFTLVRWMPWAWKAFSRDGFWRNRGDANEAVTGDGKTDRGNT